MEIHIAIETTEPLTGTARTDTEGPLPFEGWLELLHALSTLIGGEVGSARERPTAPQDQRSRKGGPAGPVHESDPDDGLHQTEAGYAL